MRGRRALSVGTNTAAALMLLIATLDARTATACRCSEKTAQQHFNAAQHVFIARASAPTVHGPPDRVIAKLPRHKRWALLRRRTRSYTLKVLRVLKGKPGLAFSHTTRMLDSCARNFSKDEIALVYVDNKNGIRLCDGNAPMSKLLRERLPQTIKLAGGKARLSQRDLVAALALGGVIPRAPDSAKAYKRVRYAGRWAGKVGRYQRARAVFMAPGKARDVDVHRVLAHGPLLFVEVSTLATTTAHRLLLRRRGAKRYELLHAFKVSGCKTRDACLQDGACSPQDGRCVVTATADCRRSGGCKRAGLCTARGGKCVLDGEADCRRSTPCIEDGKCTALRGRCVVGGPADCADARACKRRGRCTFDKKSATCVVGSDADCRSSEACTNRSLCRRKSATECAK